VTNPKDGLQLATVTLGNELPAPVAPWQLPKVVSYWVAVGCGDMHGHPIASQVACTCCAAEPPFA
jgi:hypothetical protein